MTKQNNNMQNPVAQPNPGSRTERQEKRKATLSFFLIMLAGGVFGAFAGFSTTFWETSLSTLSVSLTAALKTSSAWMSALIGLLSLLGSLLFFLKGKRLASRWDEEDEDVYHQIDKALNRSIGISSVGIILHMVWFGITSVARADGYLTPALFLLSALFFCIVAVLHSFLQRKCVELTRRLNPEKKGDALELHFQKKWLESCDEQEKLVTFHAAYKAFAVLPLLCGFLFIFLLIASTFLKIGLLPFLIVGVIWITLSVIYIIESGKNKPVQ